MIEPSPPVPVEPSPEVAGTSPEVAALVRDPRDDREMAQELERIEKKPPMYKVFRRSLYGLYALAALWLTLSIAIAAWRSVWGEPGRALRAAQEQAQPVKAAQEALPEQQAVGEAAAQATRADQADRANRTREAR